MSHFERVIREFAVDIEYVINEFDKYRYVSNHRFLRLQRRVSLLEDPSTDIIQNDKTFLSTYFTIFSLSNELLILYTKMILFLQRVYKWK